MQLSHHLCSDPNIGSITHENGPWLPVALRRGLVAAICAVLVGGLAACGSDDDVAEDSDLVTVDEPRPEPAPLAARRCPQVNIVSGLEQVVQFRGTGTDPTDVVARGTIGFPDGGCEYDTVASNVTVEMTVPLRLERGPAMAPGESVDLPYSVWVVDRRRQPPGDILMRQQFSGAVQLEDEAPAGFWEEELVLTIPLPGGVRDGEAYEILLGFQMPGSQLSRPGG